MHDDEISSKTYGNYAFAIKCSETVYNKLLEVFDLRDAKQIYCIALIFCVEGFTHMKRIRNKYENSYLSYYFPGICLGYEALNTLYTDLGSKNKRVIKFEQSNIDGSSKKMSVDGHVIACTSEKNDLSEYGYKFKKYGMPQVNWITAYDVETKKTLTSIITNGSENDNIALVALFERHEFKNTEFLVDRGFNTEADKKLMSENGNTYIVPMISSRNDYKTIVEALKFDKRKYFVYKKKKYSSIVYYQEFLLEGKRCIAYKDATREASERDDYIRKIEEGQSKYTEEGLIANEIYFGLFLLETNIPEPKADAKTIFSHYKQRWSIETFYNYIRNKCDFNAIYMQDYNMCQGLSFLITVSGMIFNEIQLALSKTKYAVEDVLEEIGKLKMNKDNNVWHIKNKIKKVRVLCEAINFEIPNTIK